MKNTIDLAKAGRALTFGVIIALCAAGCATSLNHVGAFSQASADLSKRAADAYEKVNDVTIERRISDIASDPNLSPDNETFKSLITSEEIGLRVSLLQGVGDYATALGDLASADFRKDIDGAAKDLYGALGGLQEAYAKAKGTEVEALPVSKEHLAIIATAVDAIGTVIAEHKRRTALKTVVVQADPAIQKALALVGGDLPKFHTYVMTSLDTIETDMLESYDKEAADLSYNARVEKLRRIYQFRQTKNATGKVLTDLGKAGGKIAAAHAALRKAVESGKFTTPELVKEIQGVVTLSKSFKNFYDKLIEENQQ